MVYLLFLFFFNDTATTEIYTLSLHDALPIYRIFYLGPVNNLLVAGQLTQSMYSWLTGEPFDAQVSPVFSTLRDLQYALTKVRKLVKDGKDRSEEHTSELQSHSFISYAVFCLKKKIINKNIKE